MLASTIRFRYENKTGVTVTGINAKLVRWKLGADGALTRDASLGVSPTGSIANGVKASAPGDINNGAWLGGFIDIEVTHSDAGTSGQVLVWAQDAEDTLHAATEWRLIGLIQCAGAGVSGGCFPV